MNLKKRPILHYCIILLFVLVFTSCSTTKKTSSTYTNPNSTPTNNETPSKYDNKSGINIDGLLWYAKKQLGTPYKYGSANPSNGGFDCSGFLYYVYTHFDISVPRVSNDYMNYGKTVERQYAQKGDVVIFTGSDASQKKGGHVGIILENKNDEISFIHGSTSKGVVINKLSDSYYAKRFLKIVRVIK